MKPTQLQSCLYIYMAVLSSDVVNYLVLRYLQESGFAHTAFTFGHESTVAKVAVDPNNVPPGSLVTFLQKGMQYLEMESNLDVRRRLCGGSKAIAIARIHLNACVQEGGLEGDYKMLSPEDLLTNDIDQLRLMVSERREEERAKPDRKKDKVKEKPRAAVGNQQPPAACERNGPTAMETEDDLVEVPASCVTTLNGHESEVYICAWSPTEPLLASG